MFATKYEKAIEGLELDSSPVLFPQDIERQDLVNRMYLSDETSISENEARQYILMRLLIWLVFFAGTAAYALGLLSASRLLETAVLAVVFIGGMAITENSPVVKKMSWSWDNRIQIKLLGAAAGLLALALLEPELRKFVGTFNPWLAVVIVAISGDGLFRAYWKLTVFRKGYAVAAFLKGKSQAERQKVLETLASPAVSSVLWRNKGKLK
ncbi:hypothetical protein [Leisingera sp. ANG-M6]|uniref:hypothetical protein n=1 Tax=Leisingera sp. ANG-M6 TaxID=1577900 RepID=UPI00057FC65F|nr:hypothetical protein [Leisingera sp. ANG-M6]KIC26288.1 hypothetical protein RA24_18735 [Leisingera sp. ANG-M6]